MNKRMAAAWTAVTLVGAATAATWALVVPHPDAQKCEAKITAVMTVAFTEGKDDADIQRRLDAATKDWKEHPPRACVGLSQEEKDAMRGRIIATLMPLAMAKAFSDEGTP